VVSRMGAILNERLWEFSNSLFKNLINKMRGEKTAVSFRPWNN